MVDQINPIIPISSPTSIRNFHTNAQSLASSYLGGIEPQRHGHTSAPGRAIREHEQGEEGNNDRCKVINRTSKAGASSRHFVRDNPWRVDGEIPQSRINRLTRRQAMGIGQSPSGISFPLLHNMHPHVCAGRKGPD